MNRFCLSTILSLAAVLFIAAVTPQDFKAQYLKKAASTQSIQCTYIQEKIISQVKDPIVSQGRFSYLSPGKIRLDQKKPAPSLIILTADSIYTEENGKVSRIGMDQHPYFKYLNQLIVGTVNGEVFDEKYFETKIIETPKQIQIDLLPKSRMMKRKFSNIRLFFDLTNLNLLSMEMIEKSGDRMKMTFQEPEINQPVDKTIFKL